MFETMNSHSYVGIRNKKSKFRSVKQGVLQGGTKSPVLLGFYLIDDVENYSLVEFKTSLLVYASLM